MGYISIYIYYDTVGYFILLAYHACDDESIPLKLFPKLFHHSGQRHTKQNQNRPTTPQQDECIRQAARGDGSTKSSSGSDRDSIFFCVSLNQ